MEGKGRGGTSFVPKYLGLEQPLRETDMDTKSQLVARYHGVVRIKHFVGGLLSVVYIRRLLAAGCSRQSDYQRVDAQQGRASRTVLRRGLLR